MAPYNVLLTSWGTSRRALLCLITSPRAAQPMCPIDVNKRMITGPIESLNFYYSGSLSERIFDLW